MDEIIRLIHELNDANVMATMASRDIDQRSWQTEADEIEAKLISAIRKHVGKFAS